MVLASQKGTHSLSVSARDGNGDAFTAELVVSSQEEEWCTYLV